VADADIVPMRWVQKPTVTFEMEKLAWLVK